jgi:hypothetical protein
VSVLILSVLMSGKMKEDQIPIDTGFYFICWSSSSDSRQQRVLGGDTWYNAVFTQRYVLYTDTRVATVANSSDSSDSS